MTNIKPGRVYIDKGKGTGYFFFTDYKEITEGLHKGDFQVTLKSRKVVVNRDAIKSWPEGEETEYQKAIRTGIKPVIWPPIIMTQDDLQHFRRTISRRA